MTKTSTMTPPVKDEDLQMANELTALTATVLRSAGLVPFSDDTGTKMTSPFSQAVGLLLQIDKERPELGLQAELKDMIRRCRDEESVNPATTVLALMKRAGLRQPSASA